MLTELKKLIEANPLFREKLQFPNLKNSRLRTLINQRYIFQCGKSYILVIFPQNYTQCDSITLTRLGIKLFFFLLFSYM